MSDKITLTYKRKRGMSAMSRAKVADGATTDPQPVSGSGVTSSEVLKEGTDADDDVLNEYGHASSSRVLARLDMSANITGTNMRKHDTTEPPPISSTSVTGSEVLKEGVDSDNSMMNGCDHPTSTQQDGASKSMQESPREETPKPCTHALENEEKEIPLSEPLPQMEGPEISSATNLPIADTYSPLSFSVNAIPLLKEIDAKSLDTVDKVTTEGTSTGLSVPAQCLVEQKSSCITKSTVRHVVSTQHIRDENQALTSECDGTPASELTSVQVICEPNVRAEELIKSLGHVNEAPKVLERKQLHDDPPKSQGSTKHNPVIVLDDDNDEMVMGKPLESSIVPNQVVRDKNKCRFNLGKVNLNSVELPQERLLNLDALSVKSIPDQVSTEGTSTGLSVLAQCLLEQKSSCMPKCMARHVVSTHHIRDESQALTSERDNRPGSEFTTVQVIGEPNVRAEELSKTIGHANEAPKVVERKELHGDPPESQGSTIHNPVIVLDDDDDDRVMVKLLESSMFPNQVVQQENKSRFSLRNFNLNSVELPQERLLNLDALSVQRIPDQVTSEGTSTGLTVPAQCSLEQKSSCMLKSTIRHVVSTQHIIVENQALTSQRDGTLVSELTSLQMIGEPNVRAQESSKTLGLVNEVPKVIERKELHVVPPESQGSTKNNPVIVLDDDNDERVMDKLLERSMVPDQVVQKENNLNSVELPQERLLNVDAWSVQRIPDQAPGRCAADPLNDNLRAAAFLFPDEKKPHAMPDLSLKLARKRKAEWRTLGKKLSRTSKDALDLNQRAAAMAEGPSGPTPSDTGASSEETGSDS